MRLLGSWVDDQVRRDDLLFARQVCRHDAQHVTAGR